MSAILFIVGAIALMVGVAMIGFGIPVNEFSFGNTLIVAGTSAVAGGLVVIGLAAVVAQLQRIADGLAMWTPVGSNRMAEVFEPPHGGPRAIPPAGRVPFPPRTQPVVAAEPHDEFKAGLLPEPFARDVPAVEPPVAAPVAAAASDDIFASIPSLRNPDLPPVQADEDVSPSPINPPAAPGAAESDEAPSAPPSFGYYGSTMSPRRQEATPGPAWRPSPLSPPLPPEAGWSPSSLFDSMWPARPAAPEAEPPHADDDRPEPGPDVAQPSAVVETPEEEQPRAVAILKSGVVDGMGYTLYVDGSIEAELPHGTLRFSSINDLRSYLEKNA